MANTFSRVLRIASLALPFIPGIGAYGAAAAGVVNGVADQLDSPEDAAEKKRELEAEQDKEWVEFSEELAETPLSNVERGAALKNRIRVDLFRSSGGKMPEESIVNLFAENVVSVAKAKRAHQDAERAEKKRSRGR